MQAIKLQKKYPDLDVLGLQDQFRRLDVDDKGYLDEASVIKATQQSERQSYDVVRQALKEVELDSSRRVELDDYIDLIAKVRGSSPAQRRISTGPIQAGGLPAGNGAPSQGMLQNRVWEAVQEEEFKSKAHRQMSHTPSMRMKGRHLPHISTLCSLAIPISVISCRSLPILSKCSTIAKTA